MYQGRLRSRNLLASFALIAAIGLGCAETAPVGCNRLRPDVYVSILRDGGSMWVEISNQSGKPIGIPSGVPSLNIWSCEVRGSDGRICSYSPLGEQERIGPPCGRSLGVFINPSQKKRFPFPIDRWFELSSTDHHVATVTIPLVRDEDGIDYEIASTPILIN